MCGIYLYFSNTQKPLVELIENTNKIQHRGQDAIGYIYSENNYKLDNCSINLHTGIVAELHIKADTLLSKTTHFYLAHLRYRTSGNRNLLRIQPIRSSNKFGSFSFAFNGNIPIKKYNGYNSLDFKVDTDLIKYYFETESYKYNNWTQLITGFLNDFERAYSVIVTTDTDIYIFKDRYSKRPLCWTFNQNEIEISSESCIFSDNKHFNELEGGSIIQFDISNKTFTKKQSDIFKINNARCLFELIYFMSPLSKWYNDNVNTVRNKWGALLAQHDIPFKNNNDYIVIGIPDTGIIPAKSYSKALNIAYLQAITKNKLVNRTFILEDDERDKISKIKYIYEQPLIKNKKVIIVDDSIVRGITMNNIVKQLWEIGAKEVHIRICAPEIKDVCHYGININSKNELISVKYKTLIDLNSHFKSTSIKFLDLNNMRLLLDKQMETQLCTGCFNSEYDSTKYSCKSDIEW